MNALAQVERVSPRVSIWRRLGRALKRAVGLAPSKRAYEGAGRGRRFTGWNPTNTSAHTEIAQSLEFLRARARDLDRNDPLSHRAIQTLAGNIVGGTGITARASSGADQIDTRATKLWVRWIKRCDVTGVFGLNADMKAAATALVRDGEVIIRRRLLPVGAGLEVPLRIQVLEADFLDFQKNERKSDGGRIMYGVQFAASGEIEGYWLHKEHPGGGVAGYASFTGTTLAPSEFVPASEVIHLFVQERPGQVRGVPLLAVVMSCVRDRGDYRQSVRLRKKLEACIMAFITPEQTTNEDVETDPQIAPSRAVNADGATVEEFTPGMVVTLKNGKTITIHNPVATPGEVENDRSQIMEIAAGLGMTYELMTGDYSQINYSSYKAGQIDFRRMIEGWQWETFIPVGLDRIWDWFTEIGWMVGKLPTAQIDVEWNTARWQSVEPMKDAEAAEKNAINGFIPPADIIAELGYHPETAMKANAKFFEKCKALGLPYSWIPGLPDASKADTGTPPADSGGTVTPLPKKAANA